MWPAVSSISYVSWLLERWETPNRCIEWNQKYVGDCKHLNADILVWNRRFDREFLVLRLETAPTGDGLTYMITVLRLSDKSGDGQVFKTVCGLWNYYGGNFCPNRRCTTRQCCLLDYIFFSSPTTHNGARCWVRNRSRGNPILGNRFFNRIFCLVFFLSLFTIVLSSHLTIFITTGKYRNSSMV